MTNQRIRSLDVLRGVAMMFVVLFHSAIYNFANIHKIDFSNPPLLIILMSFMALWGGIFIIYSMVVNAVMFARRDNGRVAARGLTHMVYGTGAYLILHYLLNVVLGRWTVDFVNNQPEMSVIASVLRGAGSGFRSIDRFFEGSSLSTIALNLLLLSGLLYLLLRNDGHGKMRRNYFVLGALGGVIMIGSSIRVGLYDLLVAAQAASNYLAATGLSFVLANPYPLLPYLAYGCFGAMVGLMIHNQRRDLLKRVVLPAGIIFILYGVAGMMRFDKTISTPDFFWHYKTNFELGVFLLLIPGVYLLLEGRARLLDRLAVFSWFSRVSLTVYMLETTMSEVLRLLITPLAPAWNQTINGCLLFGGLNILVWVGVLWLWRRGGFRYGLEWVWVQLMQRAGKQSTKMDLAV